MGAWIFLLSACKNTAFFVNLQTKITEILLNVRIHPSWQRVLAQEFDQPYFASLTSFVREQYAHSQVFPPPGRIFAAFDSCPFEEVKVVILGQDPYHDIGQANGLCFSVADGVPMPPSLLNILKEVTADTGAPMPSSGNLQRWADQGVLLLNATLTVEAHRAGSHQGRGWELFTDAVISLLSSQRQGLVFMLWGAFAIKKASLIDSRRHLVLTSPHPSPLSAHRGFFGNHHFTRANAYLQASGRTPIQW